jgi:hypothetical protein
MGAPETSQKKQLYRPKRRTQTKTRNAEAKSTKPGEKTSK